MKNLGEQHFLITKEPSNKTRKARASGGREEKLTEAAVQLAVALALLKRTAQNTSASVKIHPDGMHAKELNIPEWMRTADFEREKQIGRTEYGGVYRRGSQTITVNPKSGDGDVVGELNGQRVIFECKGGIINSTYPGHTSRLRSGICEAVGLLMTRKPEAGCKKIVAVPDTPQTRKMAEQMNLRCSTVGIGFVLVKRDGSVDWL